MFQGLLLVLKIIGIVLLCILAILLIVLACILFVPIRYQIRAVKEDKTDNGQQTEGILQAKAKVTWLLHLLSFQLTYEKEAVTMIKILGIPVFDSRKQEEKEKKKQEKLRKKEEKAKKKEAKKKDIETEENEIKETEQAVVQSDKIEDATTKQEKITENKSEQLSTEKSETEEEETDKKESKIKVFVRKIIELIKKIWNAIKNTKYTILKIYDKIGQTVNHIKYYIELWESQVCKDALTLCKKQLLRVLKQIRPRKFSLQLHIGTGDPATTGQIVAWYSMLYPYIGNSIKINPEFDDKVLEGRLLAKGRITVVVLLSVAWKVYFDKNLRKFLKLLKKEDI